MQAKNQREGHGPLTDVRPDPKLEWHTPDLTVIEITETDSGSCVPGPEDALNYIAS